MIYSLNQIDKIAGEIINDLQDCKVICINGDMGVGKTTLIKKIGQLLGCLLYTSPSPRDRG